MKIRFATSRLTRCRAYSGRHDTIDRRHRRFPVDPRVAVEIPAKDLLRRARGQRLGRQRRVGPAERVGKRGIVDDEETFDPACFCIRVEHLIGGVDPHPHSRVHVNQYRWPMQPMHSRRARGSQQANALFHEELAVGHRTR